MTMPVILPASAWSSTSPQAGIYAGVPDDAYHSHASVSKSTLKYMDVSQGHQPIDALHYKQHGINQTPAILNGHAMEAAVLEPDRFRTEFIAKESFTGTGAKARREAWADANAGKHQIAPDVHDRCLATRLFFEDRPHLCDAMDRRDKQLSMLWQDPRTQLWVRTRPDIASLTSEPALCWDVKFLSTGIADRYIKDHLHKFGAALQAATFREAFSQIAGEAAPACYLLAISGSGAVDARTILVTQAWLQYGADLLRESLDLYAECAEADTWPAHADKKKADTLDMPPYVERQADARRERLRMNGAAR